MLDDRLKEEREVGKRKERGFFESQHKIYGYSLISDAKQVTI